MLAIMSSQTSIAQTSFLEDCIAKKKSFQQIYEALELYSESVDARKEPVFAKDEANDLQKRVKEIAASFKAFYRNGREALLADLIKDDTFTEQIQELGKRYGQSLWGRKDGQQLSAPDELRWDRDAES
jgi:glycogen debranching enzyme